MSPIGEAVSLVDSGPFPLALPGQSHQSGANPEDTVSDPARGYITTPSSPLPARFRLAFGHGKQPFRSSIGSDRSMLVEMFDELLAN